MEKARAEAEVRNRCVVHSTQALDMFCTGGTHEFGRAVFICHSCASLVPVLQSTEIPDAPSSICVVVESGLGGNACEGRGRRRRGGVSGMAFCSPLLPFDACALPCE